MSVQFTRHGSTAVLTLASPATRNAFSPEIREGLRDAVATTQADREIRALVITGNGGVFCAGGDIRGMREHAGADGATARTRMHGIQQWMADLINLDKPVVAAVDGPAFGAGFSLALAADFVLATPAARFCLSFMRLGLVPDCGAFYILPRVVGVQRAKELMLSAREVGADEARALGIVMELHAPEQLLPRALALAASFDGASALATSVIKRSMGNPGALATLLDTEANAQALCFGSGYTQAAVKRFLDKQPTAFQWPKE